MVARVPAQKHRPWLAAVIRREPACLEGGAGSQLPSPAEALRAAAIEGVVTLAHDALAQGSPTAEYRTVFSSAAMRCTATTLARKAEYLKLADAVAQTGVRVLVLKGMALAWWLCERFDAQQTREKPGDQAKQRQTDQQCGRDGHHRVKEGEGRTASQRWRCIAALGGAR